MSSAICNMHYAICIIFLNCLLSHDLINLILNFPKHRAHHQGRRFEEAIKPCDKVLYFNVSDKTMTSRLMFRGQTSGRVDDNAETIKKRLVTFHSATQPVVKAYAKKGKLAEIHAEGKKEEIFQVGISLTLTK